MKRLPFVTAMSAASLRRFSRSAPEKPWVPRAIELRSTSSARGLPRAWTRSMASRPRISGQADVDAAVEAAGAGERVIEDVVAVRRRHYYDALVVGEAVHLDEQLVERLLALVVAAAEAAAALASDGVLSRR